MRLGDASGEPGVVEQEFAVALFRVVEQKTLHASLHLHEHLFGRQTQVVFQRVREAAAGFEVFAREVDDDRRLETPEPEAARLAADECVVVGGELPPRG